MSKIQVAHKVFIACWTAAGILDIASGLAVGDQNRTSIGILMCGLALTYATAVKEKQ